MVKGSGLILFFSVLLISFASATISMNQPFSTYNFGDSVYLNINVNPTSVSGSFEINLICQNGEVNLYKIAPASSSFSSGKEQKVNHQVLLTKEFVESLEGDCYFEISLGNEAFSSNHFFLTDIINLNPKLDKTNYNPGETVFWELGANKANGVLLDGFVEVSSFENKTFNSSAGKSSGSFEVPENAPAGEYKISFYAYDTDEGGVLNSNIAYLDYKIEQVPTSLSALLKNPAVNPGDKLNFVVYLLDQSGKNMSAQISGDYFYSKNKKISFSSKSGDENFIVIENTSLPGSYNLTFLYDELTIVKEFFVNEYSRVDFYFLENSSVLVVKNIGNVPYNSPLSLNVGEENILINLSLNVGEEKRFDVEAPTGTYDVSVSDGNNSVQKHLLLTGNAIAVDSVQDLFSSYSLLWIFLIVVFALLFGVFFMKHRRNKTFKSSEDIKLDKKENIKVVPHKMKRDFVDLAGSPVGIAESKVSMKGNKEFCSVLCISVKNHSTLGREGRAKLNEIISESKSEKGILDSRGSYLLIIYSSLVSRTFSNEILAARAGFKIREKLEDYNKRFNDKIDYNIGINAGEMICSLEGGKLNYTSLGNTILLTKRISDLSSGKLLVSSVFRQKLIRELKVNRFSTLGDSDVFEVTRITDIEANQDKLRDLLKRTGFS